jgi:glycosyltransferase involved in cell wall biosynthesis
LGVDLCLVIDNGSTDGTAELLEIIAKKLSRVTVIHDPSPFRQADIMSKLIDEFTRRRPTIVFVFDADECWNAPVEQIANFFKTEGVNAAECDVVNYVQSRSVTRPSHFSWLKAYRRATPIPGDLRTLVRDHQHSFVEIQYPRKVLFRAEGPTTIETGAHNVQFDGKRGKHDRRFSCLHLPLRSRSELEKRAYDYEPRRAPFRPNEHYSWQSLYFREALDRNETDAEWRANSFDRSGYLDVFGRATKAQIDFGLVERLCKAYAYGLYLRVPMWRRPVTS